MLKVGLNGFGRIGRSIFRVNHLKKQFEIVAINDINPSLANMAYLLRFDSVYGRFGSDVKAGENSLSIDSKQIPVFAKPNINDVPWQKHGVDIVIDASGVMKNLTDARSLASQGVRHCVVTHSPDEVDSTIILGVNESTFNKDKHFLVSSSICDANAFVPVMNELENNFGVEHGFVTTLHPWLGYQNLSDGVCRSFAYPGENHDNFALGRASTEALIPKTTSCIKASSRVLPFIADTFQSLSYRVPTPVVSTADISVRLKKPVTKDALIQHFINCESKQEFSVFGNNFEALISKDFAGCHQSVILDHRWTDVNKFNYLKLILWYDNEWGYSSRVVDLTGFMGRQWQY